MNVTCRLEGLRMKKLLVTKGALAWLLLAVLSGCAGSMAFQDAEQLALQGNYDAAARRYADAVEQNPRRHEYRAKLAEAKGMAAREHLKRGRLLVVQEQYAEAAAAFRTALELDASLEVAGQELRQAQELTRAEELVDEAEGFYRARRFLQVKNNLDLALQLNPDNARAAALMEKVTKERRTVIDGFELDVTSDKPITLQFKDAAVRDVFNILAKLSGINFILDEDIRAQNVSLLLEDATFAQSLELLLKMQNLGKKVLNAKTIIIYPKTKEKEKQFQEQVIQTFYLSNIDAKKAVNLLRTMLQLRKVYVHEELNALVIRAEPDVIKLAQQIIETADRADSEVVFDLELVTVSHDDTLDLGPKLSSYSASIGLSNPGSDSIVGNVIGEKTTTPNLVSSLSRLETFYTLPSATFDFAKTLSDSEVLASPKIRVKNKEKAKVHVGSREPVITVTINGDNRSDNIQYVDVGVKLDVEPTIQLDDTVITKLNLEVSNATQLKATLSGSIPLRITTTSAQTALTLKDGEQTVIGGLMQDDYQKSSSSLPLLGDLPIIGDLLSSHSKKKNKKEILLSITPHIVKSVDLPRADVASIWSGGEDDLKAGPMFGAFAAAFEPEAERAPEPAAPALQEPAPTVPPPLVEEPEAVAPPAPAPEAVAILPEVSIAPPAVVETIEPVPAPPAIPEVPVAPEVEEPAPVAPPAVPEEVVERVQLPPLEIPAAAAARVFVTGPALVGVGETFPLEVAVDEVSGLYSAPLFVTYDTGRFEFVRAEEGDFLKQGGQATIFTTSANRERGQLIVGYKQGAGGTGASGGGSLFHLFFKATSAGAGEVNLGRINFRDPDGNRLSVEPEGIAVEVR